MMSFDKVGESASKNFVANHLRIAVSYECLRYIEHRRGLASSEFLREHQRRTGNFYCWSLNNMGVELQQVLAEWFVFVAREQIVPKVCEHSHFLRCRRDHRRRIGIQIHVALIVFGEDTRL